MVIKIVAHKAVHIAFIGRVALALGQITCGLRDDRGFSPQAGFFAFLFIQDFAYFLTERIADKSRCLCIGNAGNGEGFLTVFIDCF